MKTTICKLGTVWSVISAFAIGMGAVQTGGAAPESASASAEYALGRNLEFGIDLPADPARALAHYRVAAQQGLPEAQYSLGRLYASGEGVRQNASIAVKYFRQAAAQGYSLAMNRLGVMHERGQGVRKDVVEAFKWYTLAAETHHSGAAANLDNLKTRLSSEQLAEATTRASRSIEVAALALAK